MKDKKHSHTIWPHNPTMMFCPKDEHWHRFGCNCILTNTDLVPKSLQFFYAKNNKKYALALAGVAKQADATDLKSVGH